jgi:hypothetical protein
MQLIKHDFLKLYIKYPFVHAELNITKVDALCTTRL